MANFNFNKVIIGGRLTADPELKTTPAGKSVCSFTVAVNRRANKDGEVVADFFNCTAWDSRAEFICKYFRKASCISIVGSLQNRSWTANDGTKRYATDILVDEANFVDGKNESPAVQDEAPAAPVYNNAPKFEPVDDSEELPF